MARLQKKHSSKVKKKRQEKDSAKSSKDNKNKIAPQSVKNTTSSSKKGALIKSQGPDKSAKPNIFKQGIEYLQGVQSELKKVTWPTRKQTIGTTLVVIVLVAVVSIFLGLFDYGFSKLIQAVLA